MKTKEDKKRRKREYAREWRRNNPDKQRKYVENWRKKNPEKHKENKRNWRKRKVRVKPLEGADVKCPYCHKWVGGLSKYHAEKNLEFCHIPNCPGKKNTQKGETSAVGSNSKKVKGGKK